MKKTIIVLCIVISILCINKTDKVIIPKESIRLRVIASSNSNEEQQIKKKIVKDFSEEINEILKEKNLNDARKKIKEEIPKLTEIVDKTLKEDGDNKTFNINYGKNYFPRKEYKNIIYEEGEYESLVVTLGEGEGNNFWCVLFPPLCLIDENNPDIEYKSIISNVIKKYKKNK